MRRFTVAETLALPVIVMVLLAACAGRDDHWTRPQTTFTEFSQDSHACLQQALGSPGPAPSAVSVAVVKIGPSEPAANLANQLAANRAAGARRDLLKTLYRSCMNARGYLRNDPDGWEGFAD